jgi:hypothetical protein
VSIRGGRVDDMFFNNPDRRRQEFASVGGRHVSRAAVTVFRIYFFRDAGKLSKLSRRRTSKNSSLLNLLTDSDDKNSKYILINIVISKYIVNYIIKSRNESFCG